MSIAKLREIASHCERQDFEFATGLRVAEVKAALAEHAELEAQLAEANGKRQTLCSLLKDTTAQRDEAESRAAELEAENGRLKGVVEEMGEEWRRMTDEIERLSTAVEWVLKEVHETISAQRGYSGASIEDYFRDFVNIRLMLYAKDVKMLQSALATAAPVKEGE